MKYAHIREEELKNKIAQDYFWLYDCTKIMGNVDFCVAMHHTSHELWEQESLLWAEAKKGSSDIYASIVQLILTIGKARSFDTHLPPPFLGALDAEKIAFVPYADIHDVFYQNDFNWNVAPSNHESKEFQSLLATVKATIAQKALLYHFERDDTELERFIKENFQVGKFGLSKVKIDKNNFVAIYNKWLHSVKPTIAVSWDIAKKGGIIDGDFYLADLLSQDNTSLKEKLFVLLKKDLYELDRHIDAAGFLSSKTIQFNDGQVAHTQFWNKYERPPKREYWNYIVERRDLLVPQDVRERKGSYFTPQIWVELSQRYIADELGEDWQDEYYVWDCAAGTGNLLFGLTNKYNIWASTLDKQDVEVMRDRIKNGAHLLEDHVFQFDFLNDDFSKLPQPLQNIITDPIKRKKLVIYINPPYAEASHKNTTVIKGGGKRGVEQTLMNKRYATLLGQGNAELFAQFFMRIYQELNGVVLAEFSKLKILQGQHFEDFRKNFRATLKKLFLVPADTFDNVKGKFPIGFFVWDTNATVDFKKIKADVFDKHGVLSDRKTILAHTNHKYINDWIKPFRAKKGDPSVIAKFPFKGNDFQNQNMIAIVHPSMMYNQEAGQFLISPSNLALACIYFAVRHAIDANWLNDRDQFLQPKGGWKKDTAFQNDCLAYTLFHGQNRVTNRAGPNHWIPFTEAEVNAREKFESNFMSQFIKGKIKPEETIDLFSAAEPKAHYDAPLVFSPAAIAVFDAGRALWSYYHAQPNCNVNASLYDIREHFQGRNDKGKMNNKSTDETYTQLIANLRDKLKLLALQIEPKVYEHGFLNA